jgi:DNA-binding PadR family transcriptional regulator
MFYLAEKLHKTVYEIEEMGVEEFLEWQIWLKIQRERSKDGSARPKN